MSETLCRVVEESIMREGQEHISPPSLAFGPYFRLFMGRFA